MSKNIQSALLSQLAEVWELCPEIRLGQLIDHLGLLAETETGRALSELGDDELLRAIDRHRTELQRRNAAHPVA